jgi:GT2 family glycosyltransferase
MNPVLILTHNCLELTKRCVNSVRNQDIRTNVWVIDNGSKDGTLEWAEDNRVLLDASPFNSGVTAGWNHGLEMLFRRGNEHVLCVGNDTVLPVWFYGKLLLLDVPFVTGVAVGDMLQVPTRPTHFAELSPNPDFSAMCIRRSCWEKVGPFDVRMVNYCSDCDFHVRAHRLGVPLWKAPLEFYHERSSTLRLAHPEEQAEIKEQANRDRAVFHSIYGCLPGTKEYEALFQ